MKSVLFFVVACSALMAACGGDGGAADNTPVKPEPALCGINYPLVPNGQMNAATLVAKPGLNYSAVATSGSGFLATQRYELNITAKDHENGLTVGPFSGRGAVCINNPANPPKTNDTVMTYFGDYTYLIRFEGRDGRDVSKTYILEAYTLDTSDSASQVEMNAHFRIDPAKYPAAKLDDQNLDICRADYLVGTWRVICKPAKVTPETGLLAIQAPLVQRDAASTWVFLVSTEPRGG